MINAVNFAVASRAALRLKTTTMSLGHLIYEPAGRGPLVAAVQNATPKGIVVVVSAGNFGGNPKTRETGYAGSHRRATRRTPLPWELSRRSNE